VFASRGARGLGKGEELKKITGNEENMYTAKEKSVVEKSKERLALKRVESGRRCALVVCRGNTSRSKG